MPVAMSITLLRASGQLSASLQENPKLRGWKTNSPARNTISYNHMRLQQGRHVSSIQEDSDLEGSGVSRIQQGQAREKYLPSTAAGRVASWYTSPLAILRLSFIRGRRLACTDRTNLHELLGRCARAGKQPSQRWKNTTILGLMPCATRFVHQTSPCARKLTDLLDKREQSEQGLGLQV